MSKHARRSSKSPRVRRSGGAALASLLVGLGLGWVQAGVFLPAGRGQLVSLEILREAGYGEVPIHRPQPNRLEVEAEVNGHHLWLVIDTGFNDLFLRRWVGRDAAVARQPVRGSLRGVAGSKEGGLEAGVIARLRLGNVEIRGVPAFFSDLTGLGQGGSQTGDGFLGASFLAACGGLIDLQNLRLYLRPPDRGSTADVSAALRQLGMTEIPLERMQKKYVAPVTINGVTGRMFVDTGASLTVLDQRWADRFHLGTYRPSLRGSDLGGRSRPGQRTSAGSFLVGGFAVADRGVVLQDLGFRDERIVGLLGMNMLGQHGGIISCGLNRLYLVRPGATR